MVIPIDAVRPRTQAALTPCWSAPSADDPECSDLHEERPNARGIGYALLLSAILWVGLIEAGRALLRLL